MKIVASLAIALMVFSCQNQTEEETTGSVMEVAAEQSELDEIALAEQPKVVQDFFSIEDELIGTKFCYEYAPLSQLILYGNDQDGDWTKFEISDHYMTAHHEKCDVLLEFMVLDVAGSKMAFLSQMNKTEQQFDVLLWDNANNKWGIEKNLPFPKNTDYFSKLSEDETALVEKYGADFVYINPDDQTASFVFSSWSMDMNLDEKEKVKFKKDPEFEYELGLNKETNLLEIKQNPIQ
jgi:hypothetical protein